MTKFMGYKSHVCNKSPDSYPILFYLGYDIHILLWVYWVHIGVLLFKDFSIVASRYGLKLFEGSTDSIIKRYHCVIGSQLFVWIQNTQSTQPVISKVQHAFLGGIILQIDNPGVRKQNPGVLCFNLNTTFILAVFWLLATSM